MTHERKCPLCGAGYTCYRTAFRHQECTNQKCGLPCRLWDRIEELQRERDEARAEIQQFRDTVQDIKDRYPEDVFPPYGKSLDSAAARFARKLCDAILECENVHLERLSETD